MLVDFWYDPCSTVELSEVAGIPGRVVFGARFGLCGGDVGVLLVVS